MNVDFVASELYTQEELIEAAEQVKRRFAPSRAANCIRCAMPGMNANNEENLAWMNELVEGKNYVRVIEFNSGFHSPSQPEEDTAWQADKEYTGWKWRVARTTEDGWQLLNWGCR